MANSFHGLPLLFMATLICSAAAQNGLTFPIRHDPKTSQFYTTFQMGSKPTAVTAVVDLGAQFLWFSCDAYSSATYAAVPCGSAACDLARGIGCVGCNGPARPGCTNDTCGASPFNPFMNVILSQGYYEDTLLSGGAVAARRFIFSCMTNDYLVGLARGATGMLGLARTAISMHKQIADKTGRPDKFSLCFPAAGAGKLTIGSRQSEYSGPLKSTALIINPVSTAPIYTEGDASDEYFIGVSAVAVAGEVLPVKSSYFTIDKNGVGGTKISTIQNYTAVHTSIYKPLVRAFNKAAADRKIRSAAAVAPFTACYRSETISRGGAGAGELNLPAIDLILPGEDVYWRIGGGNLMVEVDRKTSCLAVVDSGRRPRTAVVIGAHQLTENYLEFDLVSSVVKFSSSLLSHNTSCSRI
ncbi:probable aspartic proteinase GIP2 [Andrographis paniculata]|uniref:probable aspartic proteinase GIP2 n=1 Tax=Andrographis paniculata TaxID=175694 RepID=UPI0021E7AD67|nr:probable aspartic proteinase GIP2 [Andrographis paniculata]